MSETINYSGTLTVVTCWCGMRHAVPSELREFQLREKSNGNAPPAIHCPLGHTYYPAGESEADKLRRQLEQEQARVARERAAHDQTKAELRETEQRRRAEKGAKTKLKKRAAAGVCPCCNRTFQELSRHMATKHPEFVAEAQGEKAE